MKNFVSLLTRRKCLEYTTSTQSKLSKCLSPVDLMLLGIAGTLGSGVYVLVGQVAKIMAGPAVLCSFVIAALASVLAALCYAEFGARVPLAGSAYVYSYVSVGELWAFVIGWNLILEYVISCAAIAKATSGYIDTLCHYAISEFLTKYLPINVTTLSPYPDLLALAIIAIFTVILCLGLRESSLLNSLLTIVNLFVILYTIICGLFWVDIKNWTIPSDEVPDPEVNGKGGFFPFGIQGVMAGAGTCFFAFVGFDVIATAGEETINPSKSIPFAITGCVIVSSLSYFATSIILTLMVPYYQLNPTASLPTAFFDVGWPIAANVISIGAICAFTSCLLGNSFAMPRVIYSMASDGLLFSCLAKVSERFQTPICASLAAGALTGILTTLVDLTELIEMFSIGTLLAYTLVSVCVVMLRCEPDRKSIHSSPGQTETETTEVTQTNIARLKKLIHPLLHPGDKPTEHSYTVVKICLVVVAISSTCCCVTVQRLSSYLSEARVWAIMLVIISLFLFLLSLYLLWRQPRNSTILTFQVPWLPFIPVISIFVNIYLMISLSVVTWIRFAVWMIMGFSIYFLYSIHHNALHIRKEVSYLQIEGINSPDKPPSPRTDGASRDSSVDEKTGSEEKSK